MLRQVQVGTISGLMPLKQSQVGSREAGRAGEVEITRACMASWRVRTSCRTEVIPLKVFQEGRGGAPSDERSESPQGCCVEAGLEVPGWQRRRAQSRGSVCCESLAHTATTRGLP